jgi:hypothetical protein
VGEVVVWRVVVLAWEGRMLDWFVEGGGGGMWEMRGRMVKMLEEDNVD